MSSGRLSAPRRLSACGTAAFVLGLVAVALRDRADDPRREDLQLDPTRACFSADPVERGFGVDRLPLRDDPLRLFDHHSRIERSLKLDRAFEQEVGRVARLAVLRREQGVGALAEPDLHCVEPAVGEPAPEEVEQLDELRGRATVHPQRHISFAHRTVAVVLCAVAVVHGTVAVVHGTVTDVDGTVTVVCGAVAVGTRPEAAVEGGDQSLRVSDARSADPYWVQSTSLSVSCRSA